MLRNPFITTKNLNVFLDLSWGDLSRYKIRNDAVVCEKRALELDGRIKTLNAKVRTVEWAHETIAFCNREETQNKDVFSLAKEAFRLNTLKNEASLIIKNENERIVADKKAYAANTDSTIISLASAPRGEYWCREVKSLDDDIQRNMGRDVRAMLKNLNQLQKLVQEANLLVEASNVDETIRSLMNSNLKDKTWMDSVVSLIKTMTPQIRPLLKETALYGDLKKEYLKIQRQPVFSPYETCLKQIESGKWSQKEERDKFDFLDEQLKDHKFAMQDYIVDFNSRWAKAKSLVEKEKRWLIEADAARKQAELAKKRKQQVVNNVMSVFACLFGYIVSSLIMYVEFKWAMDLGNKFYALFIVIACSLFMVHISKATKYKTYSVGAIVGQIILYLGVIIFSLLLGYGIFNMIICCAAVACITNGCVRYIKKNKSSFRFFQAISSILSVIGMIWGMEYWLSGMVTKNFWHALWVVPVLIISIMSVGAFSIATDENTGLDFIIGIIFAAAVLIRSIGVVCGITGFGFGMFFFVVLQIVASLIGGFIGLMISAGICSAVYHKV